MKELTKAELQVMQYIWKLKKCYLKDVVEAFPSPRPAYTTISTVIRVLVNKGFVGFESQGKMHEYHARISRQAYFRTHIHSLIRNHFDGSALSFASFFTGDRELELGELEEIRQMIDERIESLKEEA